MAEDKRFGSDYSTFRPDGRPGLTCRRITGPRVPLEGVARRWLTNRGDLPWSPNAGSISVQRLQNASGDARMLAHYRAFLIGEAKEVDFVRDAAVLITVRGTTVTINGRITLTTGGTYPLNVAVAGAGAAVAQFPTS